MWVKLLILVIYMSMACTFIPLNTSWIISACAIAPGITGEIVSTSAIIASAGAIGSTVANLNDYHIFTLMFRSRRIARIRDTKMYASAERWFAKSPFGILVLFNIIPIPVDVSRPLAASHQYPRLLFAASNLLGRLVRYSIIAALTFLMGTLGWVAPVALIAVAGIIIATRMVLSVFKRYKKKEV